ncbi:MAG: Gfo/Idh/MocA family oxidoreductase, partial [Lentisphaeria bacterium]|nr:Gfo/Idh/MocA family oxidoreductase [Lentisphaeria bacterium]
MDRVKLGIVGLQRGGTLLKKALVCPHIEVAAVCDLVRERADKAAAAHGIGMVHYSLEETLASDVDAVVLATPIPDHADHVVQTLRAGKHVLSEVTAATTLADCRRIAAAARASDRKYMMEENYCYIRPLTIVQNMAKLGLFGDIYYAESDYLMDFRQRPGFPDMRDWRKDTYFGRRGHPYITHTLGPLAQLMGERIKTVVGMGAGREYDFPADNTCVLMLQTEGGKLIRLRNSFVCSHPNVYTYYAIQGTKGCYQGPQSPSDFHKVHLDGLCAPDEWRDLYDFKGFLPAAWKILAAESFPEPRD